MRLGLCCGFVEVPIKFRATMVRLAVARGDERLAYLGEIGLDNARALERAVSWCARAGIGAFRVLSQVFPLATHPDIGYRVEELPNAASILDTLDRVRAHAARFDIRLSFHPDQFVAPGSEHARVVEASLRELRHQAWLARRIGARQLTIHGGGAAPDKTTALRRLRSGLAQLDDGDRALVVLENDDRIYTVEDLLPVCRDLDVPLVYDVHHHRCNPDALTVEEASERAFATWRGEEPWVHLSSPREGWGNGPPQPHADFIDPRDVPRAWLGARVTVDVEAKAKERAVLRLMRHLQAGVRARAVEREVLHAL